MDVSRGEAHGLGHIEEFGLIATREGQSDLGMMFVDIRRDALACEASGAINDYIICALHGWSIGEVQSRRAAERFKMMILLII